MNILQIVPEMKVGGVERGTYDMAVAFAKRGHKSVVVSNGGELADKFWGSGVVHYKLPVHEKNPLILWQMVRQVKKLIQKEKIDIVHARSRVPAWVGFWATRKSSAQFLTTCHGYYSNHFFSQVMGWGKFVIVISHAVARRMIEEFHVPHARIRLIPRGVDLSQFPYQCEAKPLLGKKEITIGIIGRITPLKGHGDFLKAISKVVQEIPNLRVWIVGEALKEKERYLAYLQQLVRRLGLTSQVEFLGHQSDIPAILRQLDLLVLTTTTPEAFGRVLIEAQAVGVPVIATRVGGVVDVVEDEKTGLLVPPSDPLILSSAILKILKNPELTRQMVQTARKRVEQDFSLERLTEQTLAVYHQAMNQQRILVIKLSSTGDIILSTPSLRAIRQTYPQAWISVLTESGSASILQRSPYINEIISYDPKRRHRGVIGIFRLAEELRERRFDKVIDLQNNKTSHLAGFLSFADLRYGYRNGKWDFFLTHACKEWKKKIPAVQHQFQLLRFAGISPQDESLELWISSEEEEKVKQWIVDAWISENQKLVAVSPFTSKRWMSKRWDTNRMAELIDRLGKDGIRTVIIGAPGEEEESQQLLQKTQSSPLNLVGKTSMMELGALLKQCEVLLTHDSAPLHVAAAVGTPFIALFGSTDPSRHLPPYKNGSIIYKKLTCQPCYKTRCPLIHHQCLENVTVDEVYQELKKWLGMNRV